MNDFYSILAELLEVDIVRREDELDDFDEWDSLGVISVISMIDDNYNVLITNDELRDLITVGDLEDLIKEKRKKVL